MSSTSHAFRPWALATLLRPLFFALAIVAGVLVGERSDSFWIGLLAFLVASSAGRALRRLVLGRLADAIHAALWPAAASGFAVLFAWLGLPGWAVFLVAAIAGGMTKDALAKVFLPRRERRVARLGLDDLGAAVDVLPGEWRRKDG